MESVCMEWNCLGDLVRISILESLHRWSMLDWTAYAQAYAGRMIPDFVANVFPWELPVKSRFCHLARGSRGWLDPVVCYIKEE